MLDRIAISERFFSCFPGVSRSGVGRIFGDDRTIVTAWASKGVPWNRLKYLSDTKAISWDWLIDGTEPRESVKERKTPTSTKPKFSKAAINRRFLSLYPGMTQTQIARTLEASTGMVNDWKRNRSQVPWNRLHDAVKTHGVRWDWLIDGLEPKYRRKNAGGETW